MGIGNSAIRLLMREGNRKEFSGKILQLGKQLVVATEQSIEKLAEEENFKLSEPRCDIEYGKSQYPGVMAISDEYLFQRLGFEVVDALDQNTFEGANVIHDLNHPFDKDFEKIGTYDFIYDGGTIEHIFNIPNALKNVFDLLAMDGRIVHATAINAINHGYYNFATFFFEEFYETNGFQINENGVVRIPDISLGDKVLYTSCGKNSQFAKSVNPSLFDGVVCWTNFIATKTSDSTGDRFPQQGFYLGTWDPTSSVEGHGNSGLVHGDSLVKSIYGKLIRVPFLKCIAKYLRDRYANSLVDWEVI